MPDRCSHPSIGLKIEPLDKPWVEQCPVCEHQSRYCVTAILTAGDHVLSAPTVYRRCAEGFDDDDILVQGSSDALHDQPD